MGHKYGKVKPSQKMYQRQIFIEDIALNCMYVKQICNDVKISQKPARFVSLLSSTRHKCKFSHRYATLVFSPPCFAFWKNWFQIGHCPKNSLGTASEKGVGHRVIMNMQGPMGNFVPTIFCLALLYV